MNESRENPFPGMNPYLEEHWTDVHPRLIIHASAQLQKQMPSSLVVRVEQDIRVDEPDTSSRKRPDITIRQDHWDARAEGEGAAPSAVAVAEPLRIKLPRPAPRRIVIKDDYGRVITAVELLSPSSKAGYDAVLYAEKRGQFLAAGVNLVEIDLVRRGGLAVCLFDHAGFAEKLGWSQLPPYAVAVTHGSDDSGFSFYPIKLQERLPAFRIPLRRQDSPAVLDLQPLIDQCYAEGAYWRTDNTQPPDPPPHGEDDAWADALLKAKSLR